MHAARVASVRVAAMSMRSQSDERVPLVRHKKGDEKGSCCTFGFRSR